jgi:hypothetical protein
MDPAAPTQIIPPNPASTPASPVVQKRSNKLIFIILGLLVITGILGGGYFLYFNKNTVPEKTEVVSQGSGGLPPDSIKRPIPKDNPAVKSLSLHYRFDGKILEVKNLAEGITLVTDVPDISDFALNKNTKISFLSSGVMSDAASNDLKAGQKINIDADFFIRDKVWLTRGIEIISDQPNQSSPSAILN